MTVILAVVFGILGAAAVVGVWAIIAMRKPVEKMVGLDVITTLVSGVLLVVAVVSGSQLILDIVLVYAVLSFGAVVVLARFRERGI